MRNRGVWVAERKPDWEDRGRQALGCFLGLGLVGFIVWNSWEKILVFWGVASPYLLGLGAVVLVLLFSVLYFFVVYLLSKKTEGRVTTRGVNFLVFLAVAGAGDWYVGRELPYATICYVAFWLVATVFDLHRRVENLEHRNRGE